MTERSQAEHHAAPAKIQVKRGFSLVWIVPIVALVIGGWLAFKAINEKGPIIAITFTTADGLEAGKTKIKFKDVEIGQVEQIALNEDASKVVVTAKMIKGSEPYLTDQTKFWVVRPRISGGSVSGLSTVLSGAYIGIDGSKTGSPSHSFIGLEVPPVVTINQPGRHFNLQSDTLGSLDIGSPVYFRQIQVGQVVSYNFDPDGKAVDLKIFIEAPHHTRVTENTRFWNASGFDVTLNAQGIKVDTQSMVSILSGGIAFDTPKDLPPGDAVKENTIFHLYADRAEIQEKKFSAVRTYWMLLFDESVRGLSIGAPVQLHGIKVGEVIDLNLEFDANTNKFQVPVIVAMEPERIRVINRKNKQKLSDDPEALAKVLVEQQGLRAQLQSGNLLTGQLMVNLAFVPGAPKAVLTKREGYTVVPTIPGSFEQLQENLNKIITNLGRVPFDKIGGELELMLKEARNTLKQVGDLAGKLDKETAPQAQATIKELQNTLIGLQQAIGKDSPLNYNARKALAELTETLRAVRELADTLENRPQAIIFGKEGEKNHE
jgi:paraquat-inducible protein B